MPVLLYWLLQLQDGHHNKDKCHHFCNKLGPKAVCILSTNRASCHHCNPSFISHQLPIRWHCHISGAVEILSLSGSYLLSNNISGPQGRTGSLTVCVARPNGRVIRGGVGVVLVAANSLFCYSFQNFGYITGSDALLKRKSVVHVTTGSQALDELLGGGIETSIITEAFEEFRSGKTQLAHTLCVSTQLPTSMKGGNGKIVDSVIALFRVDFTGRGELAERQQKLAQMLSRLTKIAEEFNVAVYMTNQGIGPQTALKLVRQHGSLESILENIAKIENSKD